MVLRYLVIYGYIGFSWVAGLLFAWIFNFILSFIFLAFDCLRVGRSFI